MARSTRAPAMAASVFRITGAGQRRTVLRDRPGQRNRPDDRSAGPPARGHGTERHPLSHHRERQSLRALRFEPAGNPRRFAEPRWQRLRGRARRIAGEEGAGRASESDRAAGRHTHRHHQHHRYRRCGRRYQTAPPAPSSRRSPRPRPAVTTTTAVTTDTTPVEKSAIYRINADNTVDTLWSSKEENVYDILTGADGAALLRHRRQRTNLPPDAGSQTDARRADERGRSHAPAAVARRAARSHRQHGKDLPAGSVRRARHLSNRRCSMPAASRNGASCDGRREGAGASVPHALRQQPSARFHLERLVAAIAMRAGAQITSPNARFLQYKAELSGSGVTLENVSAAYLPQNNPPVVKSVTVLTTVTPRPPLRKPLNASAHHSYSVTVTDTGDAAPVSSTGTPRRLCRAPRTSSS